MTDEEVVENVGKCIPSEGNQRGRSKHASNIRKQAAKANDRCSERMIRGHLRSHPPAEYNVGEKAMCACQGKGVLKVPKKGVMF